VLSLTKWTNRTQATELSKSDTHGLPSQLPPSPKVVVIHSELGHLLIRTPHSDLGNLREAKIEWLKQPVQQTINLVKSHLYVMADGDPMEFLETGALPILSMGVAQRKVPHGKALSRASKPKVRTGCLTCRFVSQKP
jgi:hypothetical protein